MNGTCETCGGTFRTFPYLVRKNLARYCSMPCSAAAQRRRLERLCQICSKPFDAVPSKVAYGQAIYCSAACRAKAAGVASIRKANTRGSARVSEPFVIDGALVRSVQLTKGATALIDDADAELAAVRCWSFSNGYAASKQQKDGESRGVFLHRLIANAPEDMEVDHVNRNTLDCRRTNLRIVTSQQNHQNTRATNRKSATGIRNVYFHQKSGRFNVKLCVPGKRSLSLGLYDSLDDAARVAAEGRRQYMTHAPECT